MSSRPGPQVRPHSTSHRRGRRAVVRTLLFLVVCVALLVPAGGVASAADRTAAIPVPNHYKTVCGTYLCNRTYLDGYLGHNVVAMSAQLRGVERVGHFEFFGPAGHIANSAQRLWAVNETFTVERFMTGNKGALWCARFWIYTNGRWTAPTGNICVGG